MAKMAAELHVKWQISCCVQMMAMSWNITFACMYAKYSSGATLLKFCRGA